MRTTLTLDDSDLHKLMQFTQQTSAAAAIKQALSEYLVQARKAKALALRGQVQIDDSWAQLRALELGTPDRTQ